MPNKFTERRKRLRRISIRAKRNIKSKSKLLIRRSNKYKKSIKKLYSGQEKVMKIYNDYNRMVSEGYIQMNLWRRTQNINSSTKLKDYQ